jgi:hypothetical protein
MDFVQMVETLQLRAFLMENVTGLANRYDGKAIAEVLDLFDTLDYNWRYEKLNAINYSCPWSIVRGHMRKPGEWMTLLDERILERLDEDSWSTPALVAREAGSQVFECACARATGDARERRLGRSTLPRE